MTSTYQMIQALPGKGTDWRRLVDALVANYVAVYTEAHGQEPSPASLAEWTGAKGVRQLREAAYQASCWAERLASQRSKFIPPSPETLAWGGFLGGEHVSWTDREAGERAAARTAEIVEAQK